jgi:hypothetical protein
VSAPNRIVSAVNGIDYTYRQVGEGTPALVMLQHFRGKLRSAGSTRTRNFRSISTRASNHIAEPSFHREVGRATP